MIELIFIIILISVVVTSILEKSINKTVTPAIMFSLPLLVVLGLLITIASIINLQKVTSELFIWYIIYIFTFFIIGILLHVVFNLGRKSKKQIKVNDCYYISQKKILDKIFVKLGIVSSACLIIKFAILLSQISNWIQITYDTFQNQYSGGINFYFRIILIIVLTYLIGTTEKKEKTKYFYIVVFYIPLVLGLVKGIILIPLISGCVFRYFNGKLKINFYKLAKIIFIGGTIFVGVYAIEAKMANNDINQSFFAKHIEKLIVYLISGTQSFNINLSSGNLFNSDIENPTFAPFINFVAKILSIDRVETVPSVKTYIGTFKYSGISSPNVNTYIGMLILYNGYIKAYITHIIWCSISYILFYRAIISKRIINYLTFSLFSFTLIMAWFDYWYLHSYWYYMFFIIELINVYTSHKLRKNFRFKEVT